ncbi:MULTISPECIES: tetratricopeptide repeat protein [unclassified Polaribacter]|uniref:tetratricopeptide repeat protein n=1 Tax=unclassified Polaribacter TaxID=196858 RepID=UPI0011BE1B7F|nr:MULTISPECIES: tetratricopeptide repeat protein [unclassified Polaribacter]TXD53328.1 tetratricopeptide repeat protein [Polaribacter sp. IC063]TXD57165.1 tetratricopeptide repeat protein [Polaribacter sp. IC066]
MKFRFNIKHFLSSALFFASFALFSQQTIVNTSVLADYTDALKLYHNKSYAAAQKTFEKVQVNALQNSSVKADASYYDAMCAVKLNQTDADKKIVSFVENNPTSNKKNKAFFNVGNYYFANKKAAHALKWFQKVNTDLLSKENLKELNFKMGYGFLIAKELSLAKNKFLPLINDAKYGNDSRYYYGFIAYKLEDYGIAESTLKEIADNKSYKSEISYYLLDISFKAGQFERCVTVGEKLLKTARKRDVSEISKIVGESYFNLQKYEQSIPFLKAYKGKTGKWNNTDYYQLGYAYYQQNNFETAVSYFNKIIDQKNEVSQNAYYHLAECYLNLDQKNEALNAFKAASEMSFNNTIQEDAALNYAKLSYEEGNPFENVSDVLQNYLKNYPNSAAYNEINELVVTSFIHQQDYQGALAYLKRKKSEENTALTFEVSLYRGIQLFNEQKLQEALPFFTTSTRSATSVIKQRAHYWEAETLYRLERYDAALAKFKLAKRMLSSNNQQEFPFLDYNIGYSHFKLKEYENAIAFFNQFLKENIDDEAIKSDAFIRLGDSYFATRNYADAIETYKTVVATSGFEADYAEYQIGMSYGFRDEDDAKIIALTNVINNYQTSTLKDDALYQLANTYTKIKNNIKAHQAYDRLLEKHPKSAFIPKALVRQGLLYYSDNQNKKALDKFKITVREFPNSADAIEAVRNAKNIYVDEDNLDEYVTWTKTLNFVNVSDTELENSTFAIAERKYFEGQNNSSILSLKKYLRSFPNGKNQLKATYYLADILFKEKRYPEASEKYTIILGAGQSEFTEDVLAKLSQIYLQGEDFVNARPLLEKLEQEAYITENILFAQSNLMKGYAKIKAYDLALEYAKKLLAKNKLDTNVKLDAKTIIARTSFIKFDLTTAEAYYKEIEKEATGELKAETLYYNAYFKNLANEYEASNKVVQELIADYSAYKYWGVKSYVIMAKNYYRLKDAYQATFILENVIKNFTQFKDIVKEAQAELKTIKETEAKTNNSITPQNKN